MKNIIVISGKQYSGKDTVAKIILKYLPQYKRIGIGDAIKIELGKKLNLSFEEIEKDKHLYREQLIKLGNYGRSINKNYWLDNLSNMSNIIVPDVRLPDELNFFKNKDALLIRVNSDYKNRSQRGKLIKEDDITETALDNYSHWDFVLNNNSTYEDLEYSVKDVLKTI